MDLPNPKRGCHLTGFAKKCRTLVTSGTCERWVGLVGNDPNTGAPVKPYKCIDDWMLTIGLENSQMTRQTGASADKVATEIQNLHRSVASNILEASREGPKLINGG